MIRNVFILGAVCSMASCASNSPGNGAVSSVDSASAPVETKSANTTYKPAFTGQTRVAGTQTTTAYTSKVITNKLSKPWAVVQMPDGKLLVTEKGGSMRIVAADGTISAPLTGIPAVDAKGQGGLLDVTLDPSFATNRMIYWTFSEKTGDGNLTAVAKGSLSAAGNAMENVSVIYRATPAYNGDKHFGSRVLVDKDGNLFVSTGERSDMVTRPQAQQLNSALGKIVRITKDGQPVAGNPLASQGARPELYTYGHRNVQSLAFHPQTGDLWEAEMGPRGGDELNLISAGKNYGWPVITYGIEYSGEKIGAAITQQAGMEQPVYYWDPVISPGGMTFYSGDAIPEWKNNIFIGGLSSKHIIRLTLDGNKVSGEERLLEGENQRFRDVTEGSDGALYAVTDEGRLYRIGK